ncbi:hypothetical protein FIBSPDRAFT_995828 [Athelia psychrophila]|uniref:Aromatic compound dioxygenase n=1 Tax=Athelia psychrophila TaxID=1759441 RepID=A0A165X7I1_9AGAM|nr:hypothetical protein FIBSPDRAFT_995828 [Fibularhizoctonia sp. CBS 109695]
MINASRSGSHAHQPSTLLAAANKEAHTTEEIEVQRALQAAAYHTLQYSTECAPAVAHFTAERRLLLGGGPSLAGYEDLFDPQTYADLDVQSGQKLEANIHNNSRVLAPEVTQGPYYHTDADLIRQSSPACSPCSTSRRAFPSRTPWWTSGTRTPRATMPGTRSLRPDWRTSCRRRRAIFPGYYTGRALHIHTKVFTDWAPLANSTFKAGQFFFGDDVSETINKMWPYSTNPIRTTHGRVRNWSDGLNIFNDSHGPEGHYDPVFRLEKLEAIIDQGLVGFVTMGINASAANGISLMVMEGYDSVSLRDGGGPRGVFALLQIGGEAGDEFEFETNHESMHNLLHIISAVSKGGPSVSRTGAGSMT